MFDECSLRNPAAAGFFYVRAGVSGAEGGWRKAARRERQESREKRGWAQWGSGARWGRKAKPPVFAHEGFFNTSLTITYFHTR